MPSMNEMPQKHFLVLINASPRDKQSSEYQLCLQQWQLIVRTQASVTSLKEEF